MMSSYEIRTFRYHLMIKNNINEKSGVYLKVTGIYSCGHHDRNPLTVT